MTDRVTHQKRNSVPYYFQEISYHTVLTVEKCMTT